MCGPRVLNPTHVQFVKIGCGKDIRDHFCMPPSPLVGLTCDSKSVRCLIITTELYLRPKLQKNMIAIRLDGGKEDWTGGLLSKNYHLTFM